MPLQACGFLKAQAPVEHTTAIESTLLSLFDERIADCLLNHDARHPPSGL